MSGPQPEFRNQYLATTSDRVVLPPGFSGVDLDGVVVHHHPSLSVAVGRSAGRAVALIGEALDPYEEGATNRAIAERLAHDAVDPATLFSALHRYTGRFVCVLRSSGGSCAVSDAVGLRQIYWSVDERGLSFSSSETLLLSALGLEPEVGADVQRFLDSPEFSRREHAWLGSRGTDARVRKVLPNHYLDVSGGATHRVPVIGRIARVPVTEAVEGAERILAGGYRAMARRYQVAQPLTAGLDSRVLLAASRSVAEAVHYYVFDRSEGEHPDAWVPARLSERLGIRFEVIRPQALRDDFLARFRAEHLRPRILPKTADIQHHWLNHRSRQWVNVSTIGAEVARHFYGRAPIGVPTSMLVVLSGYRPTMRFPRAELEAWRRDVERYAKELGVPLLDLFYWEQRLGNWGALYPLEQDIAIEEVSLFDNGQLLRVLLGVDPSLRLSPRYTFFEFLIRRMWPEALSVPVNPGKSAIAELARRSAYVRYVRAVVSRFMGRRH